VEKGTGERSHFNGGLDEGSLGDLLLIEIIRNPECESKLRRPKVIDRVRGKIGSARRDLLKVYKPHQMRIRRTFEQPGGIG